MRIVRRRHTLVEMARRVLQRIADQAGALITRSELTVGHYIFGDRLDLQILALVVICRQLAVQRLDALILLVDDLGKHACEGRLLLAVQVAPRRARPTCIGPVERRSNCHVWDGRAAGSTVVYHHLRAVAEVRNCRLFRVHGTWLAIDNLAPIIVHDNRWCWPHRVVIGLAEPLVATMG